MEIVFLLLLMAGLGIVVGWCIRDYQKTASTLRLKAIPPATRPIRGGAYFSYLPGLPCGAQQAAENALTASGFAVYPLRDNFAQAYLDSSVWDGRIFTHPSACDFVLIGKVKPVMLPKEDTDYISVRHIHTPSGKPFHELEPEHPDYRINHEPREEEVVLTSSKIRVPPGTPYYDEPRSAFKQRLHQEAVKTQRMVPGIEVTAQIILRDGRILRSYQFTSRIDSSGEPSTWGEYQARDALRDTTSLIKSALLAPT